MCILLIVEEGVTHIVTTKDAESCENLMWFYRRKGLTPLKI